MYSYVDYKMIEGKKLDMALNVYNVTFFGFLCVSWKRLCARAGGGWKVKYVRQFNTYVMLKSCKLKDALKFPYVCSHGRRNACPVVTEPVGTMLQTNK